MSIERREEFRLFVKAAHDAIDEYAEARLGGNRNWFAEDLDGEMLRAVRNLFNFGRRPPTPEEARELNASRFVVSNECPPDVIVPESALLEAANTPEFRALMRRGLLE